MIRKLNFTGRKKIPKSHVAITITSLDHFPCSFDAQLDLENFNFPAEAKVFIEAYNRSSYMRFPYGTIEKILVPQNRALDQIDPGRIPLFRVKVTDQTARHGRILALADKIHPRGVDDVSKNRISLLHVEFTDDLGDRIWRLDLGDWPTLQLNNQVENIKEVARSDDVFHSLVYPEIARQILENIVKNGDLDPEMDEGDWPCLWIKFARNLPGVGEPPSGKETGIKEDQIEWVDSAVNALCQKRNLREKFERFYCQEQE